MELLGYLKVYENEALRLRGELRKLAWWAWILRGTRCEFEMACGFTACPMDKKGVMEMGDVDVETSTHVVSVWSREM